MSTPSTSTRRSRARRGDGALLRSEILDAATALLAERGDEAAVSVRAVADRVGVTPPSIYLHFADKDELIFECSRMMIGRLQQTVFDNFDADMSAVERLRAAGRAYVRFGIENPEPYRIMFMSPRHIPDDLDAEDYEGLIAFRTLLGLVEEAADELQLSFERAGVDRSTLATGLWSAMHGVTSLMVARAVEPIDFPWPQIEELVDHMLDVQLAGLRAVAGGGAPG